MRRPGIQGPVYIVSICGIHLYPPRLRGGPALRRASASCGGGVGNDVDHSQRCRVWRCCCPTPPCGRPSPVQTEPARVCLFCIPKSGRPDFGAGEGKDAQRREINSLIYPPPHRRAYPAPVSRCNGTFRSGSVRGGRAVPPARVSYRERVPGAVPTRLFSTQQPEKVFDFLDQLMCGNASTRIVADFSDKLMRRE